LMIVETTMKCWSGSCWMLNVETMTEMLMFWNDLLEVDILLCCDEY
jgi:hypothetical protein